MSCGTLTQAVTLSCTARIIGGIDQDVWLFNYDQFKSATVTIDGSNAYSITTISGVSSFKIEQPGHGNVTSTQDAVYENSIPRYKHVVGFTVALGTPAATKTVDTLVHGLYVAAFISKNGQIMFAGVDAGLRVTPQSIRDFNANASSWTIQLSSEDTSLESKPQLHFIGSDGTFATAKTEFLALED